MTNEHEPKTLSHASVNERWKHAVPDLSGQFCSLQNVRRGATLIAGARPTTLVIVGHEGEAADGDEDGENSPEDKIENHLSIQKAVVRITAE